MDISLHPEQVLKFKQWYDAVWLGDEEHGQTIPQGFYDEHYAEYVDGYTLALVRQDVLAAEAKQKGGKQ